MCHMQAHHRLPIALLLNSTVLQTRLVYITCGDVTERGIVLMTQTSSTAVSDPYTPEGRREPLSIDSE